MIGDPARRRFLVIQAVRWIGLALVMLGLLVIYGKLEAPREGGYALFLVGLLVALAVPSVLAGRWKSPPR